MSTETTRIEHDLEQTRARLDATLGALQDRLSPGQLLDQAIDYFQASGGGDFGRNLKRNVQDHPMPVALVGVGLAWLMMSGNGRSESGYPGYRRDGPYVDDMTDDQRGMIAKAEAAAAEVKRTASESYEAFQERVYAAKASAMGVSRDVGEAMSSFASRVDQAMTSAGEAMSRAGEMGRSAASSAAGMARGVRDGAAQAAGGVADMARGVRDSASSAADSVRYGVSSTARGVRDVGGSTVGFFQDQPLLLGALGVTVGALLAAVLPSTRAEDELMGDIRDDLRDRALDAGGAVLERGARVAGDVMDAATGAAEREGLTAEGAQGAAAQARSGITDIAQRVQHVVEEGAAAARKATEREFAGETLEETARRRLSRRDRLHLRA